MTRGEHDDIVERVIDAIEAGRHRPPSRIIWGRKQIARIAEVAPDTVARWSRRPGCPIKKIGGRFACERAALEKWMLNSSGE